ncbi:MAG: AAA family ATPase [Spirochaetaceae bacterium]|jgi:chromosome segregation protein|nr:AAA family ATPase [Spirochaetaceae bacterium]GMO21910.1 MAG: AAA family ATPase [Termitinemataceae bacterium]
MFLKSLDVFGFKSFADKTKIEFADGITALLGPNGCGKSNVVDAIKWALGEQKSGAMRAERMEDVIFNGCETRRPLSVAEVTLTLANDTGLLPREETEVEIKRRLYRSGESQYFINGQEKKLKDIRELFWDTGVGKAAYSVMEQGKIDQALSSKPEERRYIFEEAAGITKSKIRSRDAEQRLAKTEENMRLLEVRQLDAKRAYDTLKNQSEKTLKYRALKDESFGIERDIQLLRLKQFRDERDSKNETLNKRRTERDNLKTELDAVNRSVQDNLDLVNSLQNELNEAQREIFGFAKQKQGLVDNTKLLNEQRSELKNAISANENRKHSIEIKIEELVCDADEQDAASKAANKKVIEMEERISAWLKNIELASSQITENNNSILRLENDIKEIEAQRANLEQKLETITDDIVKELDRGLNDTGYSQKERENIQNEFLETLQKLKTILEGRESIMRDFALAGSRAAEGGALLNPEELSRIALGLAQKLNEAAALCLQTETLFEHYRASTPVFIDEFLAPHGIITKKRGIDAEIRAAKESVESKRAEISNSRSENDALGIKIEEYRATLHEQRLMREKLAEQAKAAEEKSRLIRRELAGQEAHLKSIEDELFLSRKRFEEINERILDTEQEIAEIEAKGMALSAKMEKLEKDIEKRSNDVSGKRGEINKKTEALAKLNTALERIHIELTQSETEIKNIQENFRETHSRNLLEFEERMYQISETPPALREKLNQIKDALRDLGSVNFMAVEEFAEAKERYEHINTQMEDMNSARADLEKIVAEIRSESSEKFMQTYNKIKKNFHNMFRRLFGGGQAQLRLTDSNHVLESGIEIFAQPPGKKLENITLLSGGEKSMTAVALLFATYMVKPSPFCLLDEIDAALDEDNVNRFVQLLREFGNTSQFIVITHNKKTVIGASTLIGITMQEKGITTIISVKLTNAEEAAHNAIPSVNVQFEEEDVEPEEGRELSP